MRSMWQIVNCEFNEIKINSLNFKNESDASGKI